MNFSVNGHNFKVIEQPCESELQRSLAIYYEGEFIHRYDTIKNAPNIVDRLSRYCENFITENELLEKVEVEKSIPKGLKRHIKYGVLNKKYTPVIRAFMLNYASYKERISELLVAASNILNIDEFDVLKLTDFGHKDIDEDRLSSCFAEMRTVVILNQLGFTDIKLLKADSSSKKVDIIAIKDDLKYAIDVAYSRGNPQLEGEKKFDSILKLTEHFDRVLKRKKQQLEISIKTLDADYAMLSIILDEINYLTALEDQNGLEKIIDEAYNNSVLSPKYKLLVSLRGTTALYI